MTSSFERLSLVVERLLGPEGCAWDRAQSVESMRSFLLEEAYEAVEAVEKGDASAIQEELGDLAFVIVLTAQLAERQGMFSAHSVFECAARKMVERHPHVFEAGAERLASPDEVLAAWEARKLARRRANDRDASALDGVPSNLPALARAERLGTKASKVGYDWPNAEGALRKVEEELQELRDAIGRGSESDQEAEFGDVLFALANWARKRKIDPEGALRASLVRFENRFRQVEAQARQDGRELSALSEEELDRRWQDAKAALGHRR